MEQTMNPVAGRYWLPTIPYSIVDAVNRMAAATGSVRYAMAASHGDYNGHHVTVYFNNYRKYHLCEYHWGERVVLSRGSLENALRAGAEEYRRGARGTVVVTLELTEEQAAYACSIGYVPYSEEIEKTHLAAWRDARYEQVNAAMSYEKHFGCPATSYLVNSATVEEYRAKCDTFFANQRAQRRSVRP